MNFSLIQVIVFYKQVKPIMNCSNNETIPYDSLRIHYDKTCFKAIGNDPQAIAVIRQFPINIVVSLFARLCEIKDKTPHKIVGVSME